MLIRSSHIRLYGQPDIRYNPNPYKWIPNYFDFRGEQVKTESREGGSNLDILQQPLILLSLVNTVKFLFKGMRNAYERYTGMKGILV